MNHHETPANKPSLTGLGLYLDQVQFTYPCLPAFILTEPWLKQKKILPVNIDVKCQTMKIHEPVQNCNATVPDRCIYFALDQEKYNYPC